MERTRREGKVYLASKRERGVGVETDETRKYAFGLNPGGGWETCSQFTQFTLTRKVMEGGDREGAHPLPN